MVDDSTNVKEEFDSTFKALEEKSKKKTELLNTMLVVLGISLFLFVLLGTLLSYNNYVKAKENADANANKVQVIEFKKVN